MSHAQKRMLFVLASILAFNNVDRIALGMLLVPIKAALVLSDTELGVLTGIAFSAFYAVMGIPIARIADRTDRVKVISVTTALWSVAIVASAAVMNFAQLLFARMWVAVGESGCTPAGLSLITDTFNERERTKAVAYYLQGGTASVFIGYFTAGWLNELVGWRMTFVLLGIPGLALAFLASRCLKEPRKSASVNQGTQLPAFISVCSQLWQNRCLRMLIIFYIISSFFNVGIAQWLPSFLARSYGLQTGEIGTWIAFIAGAGAMIGIYVGGEWASRFGKRQSAKQFRGMALIYIVCGIVAALVYVVEQRYLSFLFIFLWNVVGLICSAPLYATIQEQVSSNMRATAMTLITLLANLLGMGLGPLAVGWLSDGLSPTFGSEALRFALLAMCPGYGLGAWCLWKAAKLTEVIVPSSAPNASEENGYA